MKNLLWVVLAAIVLIGGYVLVTGKSPSEIIDTDNATAIETPEALPEAAQDGAEASDAAAEDAVSTDDAVADEAAAEANPADEAAEDAAASDEAATEAESAEDAEDEAVTSDDAADEAADAAEADSPLSVQGFDMTAATQLIDNSSLSETQKMALKATLQQAQDSPELLKAAIEQARAALGM